MALAGAAAYAAPMRIEPLRICVKDGETVSAILLAPDQIVAGYVLAHGAGAGMTHPFLTHVAEGLAEGGIATLRYQFPYMEKGSRHPDRPAITWATARAAVMAAARLLPEAPLIAGGKSFGGRMTSQAQADSPLPRVSGLIFLGFPLHPAGRPSDVRADHLTNIRIPMLFIQGGRDRLADTRLMSAVMERLKGRATLEVIEGAGHSFHLPARSGQTDRQALEQILDTIVAWARRIRLDPA